MSVSPNLAPALEPHPSSPRVCTSGASEGSCNRNLWESWDPQAVFEVPNLLEIQTPCLEKLVFTETPFLELPTCGDRFHGETTHDGLPVTLKSIFEVPNLLVEIQTPPLEAPIMLGLKYEELEEVLHALGTQVGS